MTQILKAGQTVRTRSGQACKVKQLLGAGGQGEVYRAEWNGQDFALKWYYAHTATAAQQASLERLVSDHKAPCDKFLWPLDLASSDTAPGFGYVMKLREPRYRGLLADIFDNKVLADDFSLYLHRPTATDPSLAPKGHDAWYVLSPVPNQQSGIDWADAGPAYQQRIFDALDQSLLPGLRQHLTTSFTIDPRTFAADYRTKDGAAFGPEPVLTQSAWFRTHNKSPDVGGLYFVGAGTHPGAGVPGVLCSAKVLERIVERPARPMPLPQTRLARLSTRRVA